MTEKVCDEGLWGEDCNGICVCPLRADAKCDRLTGTCTCKPGWRGDFCHLKCRDGYFGKKCRQKCKCVNSSTCHHISGACDCLPGWTGDDCHLECPPLKYGKNCVGNCTCSEKMVCDAVTGDCKCPVGGGGDPQCQPAAAPRIHGEKDLILSGIVGGLIVAIMLCAVIVVVVVVSRRKRRHVLGACEEMKLKLCWRRKPRSSLTNSDLAFNRRSNGSDDTWNDNSSNIYATVASNWSPKASTAAEAAVPSTVDNPGDVFYFVLDGPGRPYDKLDHTGKSFQQTDGEFQFLKKTYGHLIPPTDDDGVNQNTTDLPYDRIADGAFAKIRPASNTYDVVENVDRPAKS